MQQILTALILFLATATAFAQDALLRAKERAQYLQDYRALLEHTDSDMRMAAVEEALDGNDSQLRSLALEIAMASDDLRLQTTAIRWYVNARSQIAITLIRPERPSKPQEFIYNGWTGLILKNLSVVEPGDEIQYKAPFAQGGELIRGGMRFHFKHSSQGACTVTLRPATGTMMAGQLHCVFGRQAAKAGGAEGSLPVRVDLS